MRQDEPEPRQKPDESRYHHHNEQRAHDPTSPAVERISILRLLACLAHVELPGWRSERSGACAHEGRRCVAEITREFPCRNKALSLHLMGVPEAQKCKILLKRRYEPERTNFGSRPARNDEFWLLAEKDLSERDLPISQSQRSCPARDSSGGRARALAHLAPF
jgi:hypothetical protein